MKRPFYMFDCQAFGKDNPKQRYREPYAKHMTLIFFKGQG